LLRLFSLRMRDSRSRLCSLTAACFAWNKERKELTESERFVVKASNNDGSKK
jgi:hypothetical protein